MRSNRNSQLFRKITSRVAPIYFFEWLSGFRKQPLILLPFLIGVFFCHKPYVASVCIWFLLAFVSSFYAENEPVELLLKEELPANLFLRKKIIKHTALFLIVTVPLLLLVLLFNFQDILIVSYSFFMSVFVFVAIIVFKYATYHPSQNSFEFSIISNVGLFSIIILPLLPITLVLLVVNIRRMHTNLNNYLYAYN